MSYQYARDTAVPVDRSRGEIEKMLAQAGATKFMYGNDTDRAMIAFTITNRTVRIIINMPKANDRNITHTAARRMQRSASEQSAAYDQECRRRWREMCLVIKAKLIAIKSGITTVDREFFADIVLPNGRTMHEQFEPKLRELEKNPEANPTFLLMMPAADAH